MKKEMEGTTASRPDWMHGTNEGRVKVDIRSPGETSTGSGIEKGKAQIAMGVRVDLAEEQDKNEGGYRAGRAGGEGAGKA